MNILFHPDAELEFNEAIDYYENVENGLGLDFSIEIANAIGRIADFPKAWPIVAVMHLHRNPEYWKHRIKN
jgi:hypothetical protein